MVKQRKGASLNQQQEVEQGIHAHDLIKGGVVIAGLAMLLTASFYISNPETLPINHVHVTGQLQHVDQDKLKATVKPYVNGSFFSINVEKVRQLGQTLPWVKQVQVRRIWPDGLELIVEEQSAIAYWNDKALLNSFGEVFEVDPKTFPTDLISLAGPEGSNVAMAKKVSKIQQGLKPLGLEVKAAKMDDRQAWQLELSDAVLLVLGRQDVEQRLQRFINVYPKTLYPYQTEIAKVDMRYTNGLSVTWKHGDAPDLVEQKNV